MRIRNNDKQSHEINKLKETSAADIWAFGVMIFELIAQHHPFFNRKIEGDIPEEEIIHCVVNLPPAELPDNYPQILKDLVKRMLDKDPSKRISAKEILEIPEIAAKLTQI
ncbi:MAG: hypothetical protein EZS28_021817 [Streblomastix strix]|uniref:non-specific serine/threonine protein kinase n=1 Tax=Streblomastix strix TaxID=222440 RepID=A0A5J4VJP2_9EUKA|nr:MAG: hypothetical protein EZS28_021817 [Streblomastix strix]